MNPFLKFNLNSALFANTSPVFAIQKYQRDPRENFKPFETIFVGLPYICQKHTEMIYNFQSQSIANPVEQAQLKLKMHQEKGTSSHLSIFEVASLMDMIVFKQAGNTSSNGSFQICFN